MHTLVDTLQLANGASLLLLAAIYAVAAVFSGLSGFGFSAVGALSLAMLPPPLGVALLMALSVAGQVFSGRSLAKELRPHARAWFRRDGVMPYLAGGVLGLPVGLAILTTLGARPLMAGLGASLIAYGAWSLRPAPRAAPGERAVCSMRSAMLVGAAGGVVGGVAAFPGSALVIWNGIAGRTKEQSRALTQPYILFMQLIALLLFVTLRPELFDATFWALLALALPGTLMGNHLGIAIYRRTGDLGYRRITLFALIVSGAGMLLKVCMG